MSWRDSYRDVRDGPTLRYLQEQPDFVHLLTVAIFWDQIAQVLGRDPDRAIDSALRRPRARALMLLAYGVIDLWARVLQR